MPADASRRRSPPAFFGLVFALSLPFWLVGAATEITLLPGLPLAALMFVCPGIAAAILVYREGKAAALVALLKRSFAVDRIGRGWYLLVVLLMPGVSGLTYGAMRLLGSSPPTPSLSLPATPLIMLIFVLAGLAEELGWSGYATDPLRARWSALGAAILIGLVWAAWHYPPLLQAQRSLGWIAWWTVYTVGLRVLIVWLYANTGRSVVAAALFHASTNVSGITFAVYFDPRITGLIVAVAAAIVAIFWGPRTLSRGRHS